MSSHLTIHKLRGFRDEPGTIDLEAPITLIYGPNGSGKSALCRLFKGDFTNCSGTIKGTIKPESLARSISMRTNILTSSQGSRFVSGFHDSFSMTFSWDEGLYILRLSQTPSAGQTTLSIEDIESYRLTPTDFSCIPNITEELSSFRQIGPEGGNARILSDGRGFTSTIIDLRRNPSPEAVCLLEDLISAFNTVVEEYERIDTLRVVEVGGNHIQFQTGSAPSPKLVLLPDTGFGYQTILLSVAICQDLDQKVAEWKRVRLQQSFRDDVAILLHGYLQVEPSRVLVFEELDSHLHPKTIRRLIDFILQSKRERDKLVFTTHSPVVIDALTKGGTIQLLSLVPGFEGTTIQRIDDKSNAFRHMSMIGHKPSDLCLSNGVIWVEGPSDRIYVNWWIEHFSEGQLREGTHYMIMWMGGSNVANVEFDDSFEVTDDIVNLVVINPNHYVIVDSDLHSGREELKPAVARLKRHLTDENLWITDVPEIENYIPLEFIPDVDEVKKTSFKDKGQPFTPRKSTEGQNIWEALTGLKTLDKMDLAKKIANKYPYEDGDKGVKDRLSENQTFRSRMEILINRIRLWNGMPSEDS